MEGDRNKTSSLANTSKRTSRHGNDSHICPEPWLRARLALPPLARHCIKSFGQYSIMLCARAGSNTEFLYIGFRFLHTLSASAFLAEAAMHKYASVAGSGHGCGSSRIQCYDFPCSCGNP